MSGARTAEPAAEPDQETVAAERAGGAVAPTGPAPARTAAAQAEMLSRLPTDAARRDYVRAMGAAYGNRDTARLVARTQRQTLARLIDASAVEWVTTCSSNRPDPSQARRAVSPAVVGESPRARSAAG